MPSATPDAPRSPSTSDVLLGKKGTCVVGGVGVGVGSQFSRQGGGLQSRSHEGGHCVVGVNDCTLSVGVSHGGGHSVTNVLVVSIVGAGGSQVGGHSVMMAFVVTSVGGGCSHGGGHLMISAFVVNTVGGCWAQGSHESVVAVCVSVNGVGFVTQSFWLPKADADIVMPTNARLATIARVVVRVMGDREHTSVAFGGESVLVRSYR